MLTDQNAIAALQRQPSTASRRLSDDESAALATLFRNYRDGMVRVAMRIVRNRDDAEDVVQEVFARLPVAIARYREGSFGGWLKQVTTRQALMRLRSTARRREELGLLYLVPHVHADAAEAAVVDVVSGSDLVDLVALLPASLRRVVELRYFRGLSHEAIAAQLGISRSASEIRLCRATKQLRAMVRDLRRRAS